MTRFFVFYWIETCASEPIASDKLLRRSLLDALSQFLIGCIKLRCDGFSGMYRMHISLLCPRLCIFLSPQLYKYVYVCMLCIFVPIAWNYVSDVDLPNSFDFIVFFLFHCIKSKFSAFVWSSIFFVQQHWKKLKLIL